MKTRAVSISVQDWSLLVGESKRASQDDFITLSKQMQEQGWIVKNVLLSAQEQVRYILDKKPITQIVKLKDEIIIS